MIEQTMNVKLELDSIDYARLSTHLKFLAERVFRHDIGNTIDTTENIRDMLKENIRLSLCVNRIKKLIQKKYHYTLPPDEQTYLCIHIKRIVTFNVSCLTKSNAICYCIDKDCYFK